MCELPIEKEEAIMEMSISVEGAGGGLDWPRWKRLVPDLEQLGFAGIFLSDHFGFSEEKELDSLELMIALTYLADHTERVRFGSLVAPLSFRDPVFLARQAAAVDDLSGGRMTLGLGAGWYAPEHEMFGYDLGDMATRMDRFEEGLAVITGLLRSNQPLSFDGRFYRLREAMLPGPRRPGGPRVLIGGNGPRRTLPLVARYADVWNAVGIAPDEYRERSALLDKLAKDAGRRPSDIKRTVTQVILCARDEAELEQRAAGFRLLPGMSDLPLDALIESVRSFFRNMVVGAPDEVVNRLREYADIGVTEVMVQWFSLDDGEGLRLLADRVAPAVH
jgi:alkanesulfonate monooxygenase SsuD/methylene tetrahydromethanopterin reductase-like flavin-dependent oxidoreductase (luciferase family)